MAEEWDSSFLKLIQFLAFIRTPKKLKISREFFKYFPLIYGDPKDKNIT